MGSLEAGGISSWDQADAKVITMTDEEIAKATLHDGRLVGDAELKISEKVELKTPERGKTKVPSGEKPALLDLLAARADYFSEDAMEFILSAIDSGVDERAVRRMIAMDEGELLRICGEVE